MSPFLHRGALRHVDRLLARGVLLLALALYTATFFGAPELPAGEVEFQTTRSLARGAGLVLGDTPEARRLVESELARAGGSSLLRADGELVRPLGGIGRALAGVPFYWAGAALAALFPAIERAHADDPPGIEPRSEYFAHLVVGWRDPLFGALTVWLLLLVALRLGASRGHAFVAAATYACTSFAWPQALSSAAGGQATFLLLLAFHLLLVLREGFDRLEPPHRRHLVGFGAALGFALVTRPSLGLACVALLLAGEVVLRVGLAQVSGSRWTPEGGRVVRGWSVAGWVAAPLVAALALVLYLGALRHGALLDPGLVERLAALEPRPLALLRDLAGLLVAPGRGLLWFAPVVLAAPVGLLRALRRGELLWPALLAALVPAVLAPALLLGWHGGLAYGPRVLLPLLPFAWIGVGLALPALAEHRASRLALGALAVLGLVVQIPGALVAHRTHAELALRAAGTVPEAPLGEAWERAAWSWRLAAPWAHWRILRHRIAGQGERFPVGEILRIPSDEVIEPRFERDRGFRHLAWVDFRRRLGGPATVPVVIVLALGVAGAAMAVRGLDRAAG